MQPDKRDPTSERYSSRLVKGMPNAPAQTLPHKPLYFAEPQPSFI